MMAFVDGSADLLIRADSVHLTRMSDSSLVSLGPWVVSISIASLDVPVLLSSLAFALSALVLGDDLLSFFF
jgi:hypothetical protein